MARGNGLGFTFGLKGQNYVFSMLGNLQNRKDTYLETVMIEAPKVVNEVAQKYFLGLHKRGKHKNNSDSPFLSENFILYNYSKSLQSVTIKLDNYDPRLEWYLFGTTPHWIFPNSPNKFLRFYGSNEYDNKIIYTKKVYHPGAKKHLEAIREIRRRSFNRLITMVRKTRMSFGIRR